MIVKSSLEALVARVPSKTRYRLYSWGQSRFQKWSWRKYESRNRLLMKNWCLFDFFLFYFWGLVATWDDLVTKTQSHDSVHLCISGSLLAQFSPTADPSHCSWMPRPHTAHSPMPHWHSYSFCKEEEEENINREAEGGVEELQYLKHVVFAALHVCLCAIFLPAVYLVAWISRGRNEAAPGSWSCAAHGDVLLSTYCLLRLNLPHFSGYTIYKDYFFTILCVCAVESKTF